MAINPNESGSIPVPTLVGTERVDINIGPVGTNTTTAAIAALATGSLPVPTATVRGGVLQETVDPDTATLADVITALIAAGVLAAS